MILDILFLLGTALPISGIYQSKIQLTSLGFEFLPNYSVDILLATTTRNRILCSSSCNQLTACRTFDYDLVSKRCRLFGADTTTGSIILSSSSSSLVGNIQITPALYLSTHEEPCRTCQETRYETCSTNTSTCQCLSHTYWNGSVCALQLLLNATCRQSDACRSDMNLTCAQDCYGDFTMCSPTNISSMPFGVTIAGACNGNSSTNLTLLYSQSNIMLDPNNTLYVGDHSNRFLAFDPNNRTARVIQSYSSWVGFSFYDNRTSSIYLTFYDANLAYVWPSNQTIPSNGNVVTTCTLLGTCTPTGIVVDSLGNVYISNRNCNWVAKWTPGATTGIVVAGQSSGSSGSSSTYLSSPYSLALDEPNSFIYVVDRANNRIQRFVLGGNGVGVTVAGGNGAGSAANQLNDPTAFYLSRVDGSIYIADNGNNRAQKWQQNATTGVTIAGSSSGIAGSTPYLMQSTYGIAIDAEENYLYVSDSHNNRIQRFSLH